ncbi:MAG: hypothetical protein QOE03_1821 [Micromonosporaceae bacterium]|nr:hypothetical protein [Micromonosporaceae bacterium]
MHALRDAVPAARKLRDTTATATIDRYLLPVVALIVAVSLLPIVFEVIRTRRAERRRG